MHIEKTYMRSDEIGYEIKSKTPPNSPKDVTSDLLHPSHQADAVINLGEELEQEDQQEDRHDQLNLLFSYQFWHH